MKSIARHVAQFKASTASTFTVFAIAVSFSINAFSFHSYGSSTTIQRYGSSSCLSQGTNDSDLIRAVKDQRNVNFLKAEGLQVIKNLSDDTQGSPHQSWIAQLSDGSLVYVVYNLDMGERVPMKIGEKFAVGGEFKWIRSNNSMGVDQKFIGLVHWLHRDPKKYRPDGYVNYNCRDYGK